MSNILGAITIRQPYAMCIVKGIKLIENRSRNTNLRGRVVIHAGKHVMSVEDEHDFLNLPSVYDARESERVGEVEDPDLVYGAIIGSAEIYCCRHIDEIDFENPFYQMQWDHIHGDYLYHLRNVKQYRYTMDATGSVSIPWKLNKQQLKFVQTMESMTPLRGYFENADHIENHDTCGYFEF